MHWTKDIAEQKLAALGMDDMPVTCVRPVASVVSPDWFQKYRSLCRSFMESLSDSIDTLAMMNLTQDEIMKLLMVRGLPPNTSIRFRIPLVWGGKLDINNLFMCRTFPFAHNMDRFIISQSGNDGIWLPNPAKKIYVPAHTSGGGDGGNATEDRLTQIAAQIAISNGME